HLLPLESHHIEPLTTLHFHHRDPFDRLIAATALVEGLTLVSADTAFEAHVGSVRRDAFRRCSRPAVALNAPLGDG
ncbi:MAG TPA: PIN domain-containing protein, partial [Isosphaeraceae bacterium]|nr:PIN domain-containing protein [Isosphaeraceae bacterium]